MKRSLGESQQAFCAQCGTLFSKTRHDARFCRKAACGQTFHNAASYRRLSTEQRVDRNAARMERYYRSRAKQGPPRKTRSEIRQAEYNRAREARPWERPFYGARNRALRKHLPFDLTREWCEEIWTGRCALTHIDFQFGSSRLHSPFSPSIDRIDASRGYTKDNCRFVLFSVNSFKGKGTDLDVFTIAKAIVEKLAPVYCTETEKAAPFKPYAQKPDLGLADTTW